MRIALAWHATDATSVKVSFSQAQRDGDGSPLGWIGNLNTDGTGSCHLEANESNAMGRTSCTSRVSQQSLNNSSFLSEQYNLGNSELIKDDPNNAGTSYLVNYSADWGKSWTPEAHKNHTEYDSTLLNIVHDFENMTLTNGAI